MSLKLGDKMLSEVCNDLKKSAKMIVVKVPKFAPLSGFIQHLEYNSVTVYRLQRGLAVVIMP